MHAEYRCYNGWLNELGVFGLPYDPKIFSTSYHSSHLDKKVKLNRLNIYIHLLAVAVFVFQYLRTSFEFAVFM